MEAMNEFKLKGVLKTEPFLTKMLRFSEPFLYICMWGLLGRRGNIWQDDKICSFMEVAAGLRSTFSCYYEGSR